MKIWNEGVPFPTREELLPIEGIKHIKVHTAQPDGYKFLLGNAIIKHKGVWHTCFAHSSSSENDNTTRVAELTSTDGESFGDYRFVTDKDGVYSRSHGVYLSRGDELWLFCPRAKYDKITSYPDLRMEAYLLNGDGNYENKGIVTDCDFWPMCEPFRMENGSYLMAGLGSEGDYGRVAVAVSNADDLLSWSVYEPDCSAYSWLWGESTVLNFGKRLVAIARSRDEKNAVISESHDFGKTWSPLCESNLPICQSKIYGGDLPNGERYLVFNYRTDKDRDTLCVAVGGDGFDRIYYIKRGYEEAPVYMHFGSQWSYPYAFIDGDKLYVTYNQNKENAMLSIIPLSSIGVETV